MQDSDWNWKMFGVCFDMDSNIFFPTRGQDARPAKAVCVACPASKACLDYALRHHIRHGIWGGMSERERRAIRRRRAKQGGFGTLDAVCEGCGRDFLAAYPWSTRCARPACADPPWGQVGSDGDGEDVPA